jgi:hypothetical protein
MGSTFSFALLLDAGFGVPPSCSLLNFSLSFSYQATPPVNPPLPFSFFFNEDASI